MDEENLLTALKTIQRARYELWEAERALGGFPLLQKRIQESRHQLQCDWNHVALAVIEKGEGHGNGL